MNADFQLNIRARLRNIRVHLRNIRVYLWLKKIPQILADFRLEYPRVSAGNPRSSAGKEESANFHGLQPA
jgi:hypothetical protein